MKWLARAYDRQLPLERAALSAAADLAAVGRDDLVLDVATGTGGLPRELLRRGVLPPRAPVSTGPALRSPSRPRRSPSDGD